jgi:hypothetical protein
MDNTVKLFAPENYWSATDEVREIVANGCGTSGWKGWLVPETMWGLCITPACNIHDWMYAVGQTMEDKKEADNVFLNNMLRIITASGGWWWLQSLRRTRAKDYYEAVSCFGGPAFWDKKNAPDTMGIIAYKK